ncbi:hypothetical protein BH24ACT9_BH24ACT9_18810 [soil metagenome]
MAKLKHVPAYRIKITLTGVKPPVWRRVVLPGAWHLGKVHDAVQTAMGWTNSHLHEFDRDGLRWGQPDPDWDGAEVRREETARLHEVLPTLGDKITYTYDFGDDWRHVLLVEELLAPARTATCVAGRGACPPEDCGGPWGYAELLASLADPQHPEHRERLDWVGGPIDPEAFDPTQASEALRGLS